MLALPVVRVAAVSGLSLTIQIAAAGGLAPKARIIRDPATGRATFISTRDGSPIIVTAGAASVAPAAIDVFVQHGALFGVIDAAGQLRPERSERDGLGFDHTTFQQVHQGVRVFGGVLKAHQNARGEFVAANGRFHPVPAKLGVVPTLDRAAAERAALATVAAGQPRAEAAELVVVDPAWYGNRPQGAHLAYFLRVVDPGNETIEGFFVDAHTGAVLDHWNLLETLKNRRIHNAAGSFVVPGPVARVEGQAATGVDEVDRAYDYAGDTYDFYFRAFGRDAFDGLGSMMQVTVNSNAIACPNAVWTGSQTVFCAGLTLDDIVAHEFTHGVIDHTANLMYLNQSGQLNESYADVFGELIDLYNGDAAFPGVPGGIPWPSSRSGPGADVPNTRRTEICIGGISVEVHEPPNLARSYIAGEAVFGPQLDETGVTSQLVLADPPLACGGPLNNQANIGGNIAVIDRGLCTFAEKALGAQAAGAVGLIIVNDREGGAPTLGGSGPSVAIPAVSLTQEDGGIIKAALSNGALVTGTLRANGGSGGFRWLVSETVDGSAFRDMWNPVCMGDPDRANHPLQTCDPTDNGGVHSGSGIPNHAFALVTDGGSFNGVVIGGIGPIKSGAVWYRALTTYLTVVSDFRDAKDGLNQAAADLIGTFPLDPRTGFPSSSMFTVDDAAQVDIALLAVEMDTAGRCGAGVAILDPAPAPLCASRAVIFEDDFEHGVNGWAVDNTSPPSPYNWIQTTNVPFGGSGTTWFGADKDIGNCDTADESAIHMLISPRISIPANAFAPTVTFTHWIGTEAGFDGGNVKVSVNGSEYQLIPESAFTFNPYNAGLQVANNTNPLAGEPAFTGIGNTWGTSIIDLSGIAGAGATVRFRFDFGKDGCVGIIGWHVADFAVVDCLPPGNGDFDESGRRDLRDHAAFQQCFGLPILGNRACQPGDADADGDVDRRDYALLSTALQGP